MIWTCSLPKRDVLGGYYPRLLWHSQSSCASTTGNAQTDCLLLRAVLQQRNGSVRVASTVQDC